VAAASEKAADSKGATASPGVTSDDVVDNALQAAAGTRRTARWVASALATLPTLTVLGAFVRAPGERGFDWFPLALGILLVTGGAALGLYALARVFEPVPLTDDDLTDETVKAVPSSTVTSKEELLDDITRLNDAIGQSGGDVSDKMAEAKGAEAAAASSEAQAIRAEAAAKAKPKNDALKRKAERLRAEADAAAEDARAMAALAAEKEARLTFDREQLERRLSTKQQAYLLLASTKVGDRFADALQVLLPAALGLVAFGLIFLALAPKEKEDDSDKAEAVALVELTLNDAGRDVIECDVQTLQALQITADEKAPTVITLPTADCPNSRVLAFPTEDEPRLGTLEPVEPSELETEPSETTPTETETGEG
jgi:hypothetical protein